MWADVKATQTQEARIAFERVFVTADPYGEPFSSGVARRSLVFPTDHYALNDAQYTALADAAHASGDVSAFIVDIEDWRDRRSWGDKRRELWEVVLGSVNPYRSLPAESNISLMQTAMFSQSGLWGLQQSDEFHAIVGGDHTFMDAFELGLGVDHETQIRSWIDYWYEGQRAGWADATWLPRHLQHLIGPQRASELLAHSQTPPRGP